MKTTKQLVLVFQDEIAQDYTLRINDPKDTIDEATVMMQMNAIIQANIINSKGFDLAVPKAAYIREVVITEYV